MVAVNVTKIDSNVIAGSKHFTIDIALPRTSAVQVSATSGSVAIQNLNGPITLNVSSDRVIVKNVAGLVSLSTGSGDIELEQVRLQGHSQLKTSSGDIKFDGSLDPQGSYQVQTVNGDVSISLPRDTSFSLKTLTRTGEVKNEFNADIVGSEPHPLLALQSNSGDIVLKKVN